MRESLLEYNIGTTIFFFYLFFFNHTFSLKCNVTYSVFLVVKIQSKAKQKKKNQKPNIETKMSLA